MATWHNDLREQLITAYNLKKDSGPSVNVLEKLGLDPSHARQEGKAAQFVGAQQAKEAKEEAKEEFIPISETTTKTNGGRSKSRKAKKRKSKKNKKSRTRTRKNRGFKKNNKNKKTKNKKNTKKRRR